MIDGQFGFGQVMGEEAIKLGIDKAAREGVAVVALRNSGHLGRIGDWAEMAASAGKVSLHFVNTSGGGILVAPFGGTQRRLSANPIAAGVPVADGAADHRRYLDLHDRRGQNQGRLQQGRRSSPTAASSTVKGGRPSVPRRFTPRRPGRFCRWVGTRDMA